MIEKAEALKAEMKEMLKEHDVDEGLGALQGYHNLICRKCLTTWGILFFSPAVQIYFYLYRKSPPLCTKF
ncbi:MAG: hypothetical protein A2096_12815 [Spirochaetes bacterium GWF1_41_5]|nr:MAG: hypothetical protein A2096_12815 [Spirochaetes bacterium GWF1_41_5]